MFTEKSNRKKGASLGLLSGHYTTFSASFCCVRLDGPTFGWVRDGGWAIARPNFTEGHVYSHVTSGSGTSGFGADSMWLKWLLLLLLLLFLLMLLF